jgi:hypothetical protein
VWRAVTCMWSTYERGLWYYFGYAVAVNCWLILGKWDLIKENSPVTTTVCVGNLTERWHQYFCTGIVPFIGMSSIEVGFSGSCKTTYKVAAIQLLRSSLTLSVRMWMDLKAKEWEGRVQNLSCPGQGQIAISCKCGDRISS